MPSGFYNGEIMFADNLSFDGTESPGKVTTDGQILIGSSVAPNIRVGTLASADGSVIITTGNGTIDLSAGGGSAIETINGDTGSITGSTVTIYANNAVNNSGSTVRFVNSGTVSTLNVSDTVKGNTLFGFNSGNLALTGINNSALGQGSLSALTTGSYNCALGRDALLQNQSGIANVALGWNANVTNILGSYNTAIGMQALQGGLAGANIAIGFQAMLAGGSTSNTICLGYQTGFALSSGTGNVALGILAMNALTSGSGNTICGNQAGQAYTTSESNNILLGNSVSGVAGDNQTTRIGSGQTRAFLSGITGVTVANSAPVGIDSNGQLNSLGFGTSGQVLTSTGATSPTWQTAGGAGITSVLTANATPQFALVGSTSTVDFNITNLVLGSTLPSLFLGENNVGMGLNVLGTTTSGSGNVAIGANALIAVTTGSANVALGSATLTSLNSGSKNIAIGRFSLESITGSQQNVALGGFALQLLTTSDGNNTAVGHRCFSSILTGTQNIGLGEASGTNLTGAESSNIIIGNLGVISDNNTLRIGTNGSGLGQINKAFVAGITGVTVASSAPVGIDSNGQLNSLGFGTSGQVLTSTGATSPTWQSVSGGILTATVTLTSAQIKNLNATPIEIIPAQGAGTVITIVTAVARFIYGGTNVFVAGAGQSISLYFNTLLANTLVNGIVQSNVLTGTTTRYSQVSFNSYSNIDPRNLSVVAHNPISPEISGNAANDNTLVLEVKYYVTSI